MEKERNQGGKNNKNTKKRKKVLLEGWKKNEIKEEETTKILRKGKSVVRGTENKWSRKECVFRKELSYDKKCRDRKYDEIIPELL